MLFGRLVTVYAAGVSALKLIDAEAVDPLATTPTPDLDTLTIVFTVNCNLTVIDVVEGENTGDPPAPLIDVIGFDSGGGGFVQGGGGSAQALDAAARTPPASIQDAGTANLRCRSPQRLNNSLSRSYALGAHSFAAKRADASCWRKAISPIRRRAAGEPCPAGNAGNQTFNCSPRGQTPASGVSKLFCFSYAPRRKSCQGIRRAAIAITRTLRGPEAGTDRDASILHSIKLW
jgi:hypothetical protein